MIPDNENRDTETSGGDMLCAILYLENSDTARFADLKKCVKNDYVLNKA